MNRANPHFDDHGNFDWQTEFSAALKAAREGSAHVLIEFGREL